MYRGKAICYGLGSFLVPHRPRRPQAWRLGRYDGANVTIADHAVAGVGFRFVRHNVGNETVFCRLAEEQAELADIRTRSADCGTRFDERDDEVLISQVEGAGE